MGRPSRTVRGLINFVRRCLPIRVELFISALAHCVCCASLVSSTLAATTANYLPVRTVLPDGTVVSKLPGDANVTRKPNGTLTVKDKGATFTMYPDGTTFTEFPGGGTISTHPDGRTTTRLADGTRITRAADGKVTTQLPLGGRVTTAPGGPTYINYPDGSWVEINPDGGTKTRKPADDLEIFTKADGTATIFLYSGPNLKTFVNNGRWTVVLYYSVREPKTVTIEADGTIITEMSDGSKITTYPDGRQRTDPPPGRSPSTVNVPPLQQQRPATGTIVIPGPTTPGTTITGPAPKSGTAPVAPKASSSGVNR